MSRNNREQKVIESLAKFLGQMRLNNAQEACKKSQVDRSRTKPCSNVRKIPLGFTTCNRHGCTFAHSIEELRILDCNFGSNCRNKPSCPFLHPSETKKDVYSRTNITNCLPQTTTRIIVEIEDSDEENKDENKDEYQDEKEEQTNMKDFEVTTEKLSEETVFSVPKELVDDLKLWLITRGINRKIISIE